MPPSIETLERKVLTLPPSSRVKLAERILESVDDFTDPDVAAAWDAEIKRRLKEIKDGKVRAIPAAEVFAKVRRALRETRRLSSARRK